MVKYASWDLTLYDGSVFVNFVPHARFGVLRDLIAQRCRQVSFRLQRHQENAVDRKLHDVDMGFYRRGKGLPFGQKE
jgi:hypothetical protein